MGLTEIKNRITDLLYGTTAPQGEVWKAIHEIEELYRAKIKKLEEDRDAAVEANHSVRVCAEHTADITDGEGCLVCDLAAAVAREKRWADGCEFQRKRADTAEAERDAALTKNNELREETASMRKIIEGGMTGNVQKFCEGVNERLDKVSKPKVKPEVINWSQLTKKHRIDEDSPEAWADFIIVAAMTKKCPRGEFHELFDLMERPTDRLEIVLTINDVQVPFMKTIQRFHQVVEDRVQSRLGEVLNERFGKLDDFLDDVRDTIQRAAKEKLGLKIEVEEEDR
jgi:hypothetical protein